MKRASRHFTYFFDDLDLARELKIAQRIGLFRHFLPSLDPWIKTQSVRGLEKLFPYPEATKPVLTEDYRVDRFEPLLEYLTLSERQTLLNLLAGFYPQINRRYGMLNNNSVSVNSCRRAFSSLIKIARVAPYSN